jgi:DNA-binding response OmpR family regulator
MLEHSGYKVETATGGSEAFKKFQSGSYQMVITDLRMPAGDGISLLKNIRSIDSTTPVLCVTGFSEIPCSEIIQMGANAVLDKPLNTEIIINTIKENLNQIS